MINILHLYYDILNLYGENANPRAIVNELKRSKIVTPRFMSIIGTTATTNVITEVSKPKILFTI